MNDFGFPPEILPGLTRNGDYADEKMLFCYEDAYPTCVFGDTPDLSKVVRISKVCVYIYMCVCVDVVWCLCVMICVVWFNANNAL